MMKLLGKKRLDAEDTGFRTQGSSMKIENNETDLGH
jgi:hypothetical protein